MAAYALRRLLWLLSILFFISLVTFALMHQVEGGPFDEERPLPPAIKRNLEEKYGLDKPVWRQYLMWVGNAVQGDLGISMQRSDADVTEILLSGARVTAVLGITSLALASVAGVGLGVLSAVKKGGAADYAGVFIATAGSAVPGFVLGVFLIYVFGVELKLLPTFGWNLRQGVIPGWLPPWQQMVLPVVTLTVLPAAFIARITRAAMLDVLDQDYMRTARAKGLARHTVIARHGLRNAAVPLLSVLGPIAAALITGSFIIEQLFTIPGTGRLFVHAITARDYSMIMGATLFYAAIAALANLAIDIAYGAVDPRIRYR